MENVVERIQAFNQGRNPSLIQRKYGLMRHDVFAFFRGTCHLFYEDWPTNSSLNQAPATWVCGDLHLQNLGSYKGDNRLVYFGINDFDEAALAPCTWDLARLLTCLLVSAGTVNITQEEALTLCQRFLKVYTETLAKGQIQVLDKENADGIVKDLLGHVQGRSHKEFLDDRTQLVGSVRKLLMKGHTEPITDSQRAEVSALVEQWAAKQIDPGFFTVLDVAQRTAGIGSLGVERYVVLVEGKGSPDKNYLLDLKATFPSSLQSYLKLPQPQWGSQAERAVSVQHWMQGISPALLTAIAIGATSYVLRELQPTEDKVDLGQLAGKTKHLKQLVAMVAHVVAWGQLRSCGRQTAAPAPDLMNFARLSEWQHDLLNYVQSYAVEVEHDYHEFCSAFDSGTLAG